MQLPISVARKILKFLYNLFLQIDNNNSFLKITTPPAAAILSATTTLVNSMPTAAATTTKIISRNPRPNQLIHSLRTSNLMNFNYNPYKHLISKHPCNLLFILSNQDSKVSTKNQVNISKQSLPIVSTK